MAFPKGKKRPAGAGRKKNTPNKATVAAREAIAAFVDSNSARLQSLLDQIEKVDGPQAAWNCIMDLIEYHVPKLARTELTGKDGETLPPPATIIIKT